MASKPRATRWTALERLRVDAGHTTASLGRAAGLAQSYVWELEAGNRLGRPNTIRKLARVFGMTASELVATQPPRPPRVIEDDDPPMAEVA